MYAGSFTALLLLLCCHQLQGAVDGYEDYDSDRYTFDELQEYLNVFEKKMQSDLAAFERRMSTRQAVELKRIQRTLQRRMISKLNSKVRSQIEHKITDLVKDGTMKSFVDNTMLDQINSLQKGMRVVKTSLNKHTVQLSKMTTQVEEEWESVGETVSRKIIPQLQDVQSHVNTSVMEIQLMKEEISNTSAIALQTVHSLSSVTKEMASLKGDLSDMSVSVNSANMDIRSAVKKTNNLEGEIHRITENITALKNLSGQMSQKSEYLEKKLKRISIHLNLTVVCDAPQFGADTTASTCTNWEEGNHCEVTCPSSALLEGQRFIKCSRNQDRETGYWDWGQSADPTAAKPHCKESQCSDLRSPQNGVLACMRLHGKRFCQAQCNEEYDISDSMPFPQLYLCRGLKWNSHVVNDCSYRTYGDVLRMPEYHYFSGDCSAARQEIIENFIRVMRLNDVCGSGGRECETSNIVVYCGDQGDDDDFWLDF